ncbi:hypothetical protein AKJ16_DCAP25721 [Drosera capensis]
MAMSSKILGLLVLCLFAISLAHSLVSAANDGHHHHANKVGGHGPGSLNSSRNACVFLLVTTETNPSALVTTTGRPSAAALNAHEVESDHNLARWLDCYPMITLLD